MLEAVARLAEGVEDLRLGPDVGLATVIRPDTREFGSVMVRWGVSPSDPGRGTGLAAIRIDAARLSVRDGAATVMGEIELRDLMVLQASLPDPRGAAARTVLVDLPVPMRETPDTAHGAPAHQCVRPCGTTAATPIGRLKLAQLERTFAALGEDGNIDVRTNATDAEESRRLFETAYGDRSGDPARAIHIVADGPLVSRGLAGRQPTARLRRLSLDLCLKEADAALPDASTSQLLFHDAVVRLLAPDASPLAIGQSGYPDEETFPETGSFVLLDAPRDGLVGRLDLSRATL